MVTLVVRQLVVRQLVVRQLVVRQLVVRRGWGVRWAESAAARESAKGGQGGLVARCAIR